jgi:hypothetical protein
MFRKCCVVASRVVQQASTTANTVVSLNFLNQCSAAQSQRPIVLHNHKQPTTMCNSHKLQQAANAPCIVHSATTHALPLVNTAHTAPLRKYPAQYSYSCWLLLAALLSREALFLDAATAAMLASAVTSAASSALSCALSHSSVSCTDTTRPAAL